MLTRADKGLIFSVLFLALGGVLFTVFWSPPAGAAVEVVVSRGGTEIARYPMADVLTHHSVSIPGGEAILEMDAGRVRILPMPRHLCPDQICSITGWINRPFQVIVCAPNKLIVSLEFKEESYLEWDGVRLDGYVR